MESEKDFGCFCLCYLSSHTCRTAWLRDKAKQFSDSVITKNPDLRPPSGTSPRTHPKGKTTGRAGVKGLETKIIVKPLKLYESQTKQTQAEIKMSKHVRNHEIKQLEKLGKLRQKCPLEAANDLPGRDKRAEGLRGRQLRHTRQLEETDQRCLSEGEAEGIKKKSFRTLSPLRQAFHANTLEVYSRAIQTLESMTWRETERISEPRCVEFMGITTLTTHRHPVPLALTSQSALNHPEAVSMAPWGRAQERLSGDQGKDSTNKKKMRPPDRRTGWLEVRCLLPLRRQGWVYLCHVTLPESQVPLDKVSPHRDSKCLALCPTPSKCSINEVSAKTQNKAKAKTQKKDGET